MSIKGFLLITFFYITANAQNVPYNPETSNGKLYEYAQFSKTPLEITAIKDIVASFEDINFQNLTSANQSLGFTSDQYWVTFRLENSSAINKTYYLETARPITDIANLYQLHDDTITVMHSGDNIPFDKRQVSHRGTIFKINLPKKSAQLFYLHLKSDGETLNIPLNLYTENEFWSVNYDQQLFLGMFYGLLFLAGLTYLFFFTSLSNRTFLYYSLYVFSIASLQFALDGFIFQYILPIGGYINNRAVLITALLTNFFLLKYCEHFLKVKNRTSHLKIGFKIAYGVIIILGLMLFINEDIKALVYPISNINGLLTLVLILITLFYLRYKKIAIDPFFSIGIFFLVVGLLCFVLNNLSVLPNSFVVLNSAKFGIGLEVIFLSLSMTNLIRNMRLEKEQSQIIALRKSEEISDLKSHFMSNMSHELRTPINAIMGIADNELVKKSPGEHHQNFEIIKYASLNLLGIINDIIDFERIEKNELTLRNETFDLKKCIILISTKWQSLARKKGLEYHSQIDKNLPYSVEGDADRFTQIINNILSNAVKFTSKGTIKLTVNGTTVTSGIVDVVITISDTGIGIDQTKKLDIYNSFGQMRLNDKRRFGGIGLGLSITKYLIEQFEGTIDIESKKDFGTKVTLLLPLKIGNLTTPIVAMKEQKSTIPTLLKILIVEDHLMNQMIMKKTLDNLSISDYKVAINGEDALAVMRKIKFDIILMDLQMPVMDGYETTVAIRSGKESYIDKDIPIIAVTADATESAREKALHVGMNDYITKPVNRELLFEKISKYGKN